MKNTASSTAEKHVALYIRVSSEEQAEKGDSIRDQKERGLKYIRDHETMVLQDIYIDDGVSGQKLERDDFTRLIGNVRAGLIDLIIFTKLDRWFRSLRHYLNTQAILEKHKAAWTAIDQPYFDTSTPYGRAFVAQSMTWAELEAQNCGIRVADVFRTKVGHGEVITGKVPRGYRIEGKRMVFSEEAPAVLDAILYFHRCQSLSGAASYLKETHGIAMTPQNFKMSLLRNEKITGRYRGNDAYCPRLVSDEIFKDIQRILDCNATVRSNQKYTYLFSGLLLCDACGHKMSGCHITAVSKKKNGAVTRYRYPAYECRRHRADGGCANKGEIREARIEEYLLSLICGTLDGCLVEYEIKPQPKARPRSAEERLKRKLTRLKDLYLNEALSLEEYLTDRKKCEAQLSAIHNFSDSVSIGKCDTSQIKSLLSKDFSTLYRSLTNLEKRSFWRAVLLEIRVSESRKRHRDYTVFFL